MWIRSLGRADPLEEGMATHSRILAGEIPWTGKPVGLQSRGCKESDMTEQLNNKQRQPLCNDTAQQVIPQQSALASLSRGGHCAPVLGVFPLAGPPRKALHI